MNFECAVEKILTILVLQGVVHIFTSLPNVFLLHCLMTDNAAGVVGFFRLSIYSSPDPRSCTSDQMEVPLIQLPSRQR